MDLSSFAAQLLNGLAQASSLFLIASGLSLIFGVTRVVNFAHGSFFMLGLYVAYGLTHGLGQALGLGVSYWPLVLLSGLLVGLLGAAIEVVFLRPLYPSPEIFQLLGTFALVLIFKDAALYVWGAEDLLGPRAPGLSGAVELLGRKVPSYDLFLVFLGPGVLALLWFILRRTRWGVLIRAASLDREMVGALGVEQRVLFTSVFALGCALAGWAGALQLPREPANLNLDLLAVGEAFVVVVVGGLGSVPGAYLAALLISEVKAVCIAMGSVEWGGVTLVLSKLTLVAEFLVMAVVLIFRPWGLLGRAQRDGDVSVQKSQAEATLPSLPVWVWGVLGITLFFLPTFTAPFPYVTVLAIDLLVATLFACSLYFLMGPAGMLSFGHAAFLGLGAYSAALLSVRAHWPMEITLCIAPLISGGFALFIGWFCVRLKGVYLAMLTLAFSQVLWSICFQWDEFTGGSNGLTGVWPSLNFQTKAHYYQLTLVLVGLSLWIMRLIQLSPLGFALRAARDSSLRAQAIGIEVRTLQWMALGIAGVFAGLSGALFAFSKGSISPDSLGISKSIDALLMVLLGGLQSPMGPILGALSFTWLQDVLIRETPYWRSCLGGGILVLVLLCPKGLMGIAVGIDSGWRKFSFLGSFLRSFSRSLSSSHEKEGPR
jgi:branched-chain amino acid transport system permease protein